jgi:hypothetical protein
MTRTTLICAVAAIATLGLPGCDSGKENCVAGRACVCTESCTETCGGDGRGCAFECHDGATCHFSCPGGGCGVNCLDAASCTVDCSSTAACTLSCPGNGCGLECTGGTTDTCTITE